MFGNLKEVTKEKRMMVKILAVLLVLTLTFTNLVLLGKLFGDGISYAMSGNVNSQNSDTNVDNVKFDVYLDTNNRGQKSIKKDINSNDVILYAEVKVQGGGVLKDAALSFGDTNFRLAKEGDTEKLSLGIIPSGQGITIELPIKALTEGDVLNVGLLDMLSEIKLTGKYTNNDGDINNVESREIYTNRME